MLPVATLFPHMLFGLLLFGIVTAITIVDLNRLIIPDALNLSLAAGGFAFQAWSLTAFPFASLVFSSSVVIAFFLVRLIFVKTRGVAGLGLGDVKMAGASSFWFSPWNLPLFMLLACCSALLFVALTTVKEGRAALSQRFAFGPFLGFGVFATWLIERTGVATFIPGFANSGGY